MTHGRGALTVLHLLLVWAAMTVTVPALGFGLLAAAWGGGAGAAVPLLVLVVPLAVGLLATTGVPVRTVVPLCGTAWRRFGWAAMVFVLGTLGVLGGLAAYSGGVGLGSAGTRIALTGVPYAVAAAFFVPGRWVRLGAAAVLAAGVVHGGFAGPARAEQHRHEAEAARYREREELLYLGTAPPGMRVSRATVGPGYFGVEYRPGREGGFAYVGLTVRPRLTPELRCPEPGEEGMTCTVVAHGEIRMVRELPAGERSVTLVRRHRDVEAEVTSQTLDEAGLRRLLDTLRPLSDAELERLMRDKVIDRGF
ncbi:hypothetical protein CP967_15500 [Streptomyces nitrosporeus]|uniref:Uncharacterized protein n=1 Tax=Streptomyces nitrosporeus TaxID=28894 RepID=A0A5J6FCI8_9ACTN|nr:hypothetical protein [Streptomyces nitrosporeus]QEU73224.1 hypothetical protein CP967_15500 [Streptomyces nitrosporeus]GGZ09596.1 hypothetical protein GCM10010327_45190 [Streptomyces nitrosporeus]